MTKIVYIHVGPPKTGTSAVQKWLNANTSLLAQHSVLYPPHAVDKNGVSSGNVRNIYDIDDGKTLHLNQQRLDELLYKFESSDHNILLLSSEFFFVRMEELKAHIPQAIFIAYVRNPLEVKESIYNQSVKRHFQINKINVKRRKRLTHLNRLSEFAQAHKPESLCVRLFGYNYFKNGNIVSDLLSVIDIDVKVSLPSVNGSYQFEALEFKRWLNQFELHEQQPLIDGALQSYTKGISNYTLIPNEQYTEDSAYYSELINEYAQTISCKGLQTLITDMKNASPKPYRQQSLSVAEFLAMCEYLQNKLHVDYYLLTKKVSELPIEDNVSLNTNFHALFVGSCKPKYKYIDLIIRLRSQVRKVLSAIKHKQ